MRFTTHALVTGGRLLYKMETAGWHTPACFFSNIQRNCRGLNES
jgi:hypothetical protein